MPTQRSTLLHSTTQQQHPTTKQLETAKENQQQDENGNQQIEAEIQQQQDGGSSNEESQNEDEASSNEESQNEDEASTIQESQNENESSSNEESQSENEGSSNEESQSENEGSNNEESQSENEDSNNEESQSENEDSNNEESQSENEDSNSEESQSEDEGLNNEASESEGSNNEESESESSNNEESESEEEEASNNEESESEEEEASNNEVSESEEEHVGDSNSEQGEEHSQSDEADSNSDEEHSDSEEDPQDDQEHPASDEDGRPKCIGESEDDSSGEEEIHSNSEAEENSQEECEDEESEQGEDSDVPEENGMEEIDLKKVDIEYPGTDEDVSSACSGESDSEDSARDEDELERGGGLKLRRKIMKKASEGVYASERSVKSKGKRNKRGSPLSRFANIKTAGLASVMTVKSLFVQSIRKDFSEVKKFKKDYFSKDNKKRRRRVSRSVKVAFFRLGGLGCGTLMLFLVFFMSTNMYIHRNSGRSSLSQEMLYDPKWFRIDLSGEEVLDLVHVHVHKISNSSTVKIKRLPGLDPPQYMNLKPSELVQIRRPAVRKMRPEDTRATRTFGCLRDGCRGLAIEDLLDRDWQMRFRAAQKGDTYKSINYRVTFLLTDTTQLNHMQKIRPDLFKSIYEDYEGKSYLTAFQGGDAIGGNKGQQLKVKESFVAKFGCKYNDLGISPMSYRLYREDECKDLSRLEARGVTWLLKPETGSQGQGITFHSEVQDVKNKVPKFFPCSKQNWKPTERYLVQEYLEKPLLLKKCKFDVRVYMLIASSSPFLVFYHEGYLRRALAEYAPMSKDRRVYLTNTHFQSMKKGFKLSDHIWPFSMMQDHLRDHDKTGAHYVETVLNPYIKKVAMLIFQSARKKFRKRKGTFHIFGIDFMIDANYHAWFIESNGYPGFTWSINFDSRNMVEEYFNLGQQVHENPQFYTLMRAGDRYGSFEMIFNEIEEETTKHVYNPCQEFLHNRDYSAPLKLANRRFAKYTGKSGTLEKFKDFTNGIPGLESFAGNKGESVRAQVDFFKEGGCNSRLLRYMPATYLMHDYEDCKKFFDDETRGTWVLKPVDTQGGEGVQIYTSVADLKEDFGTCENPRKGEVVAQKFIRKRHLFNNKWWDMKVFLVVSTTNPYFVFYRRGYLRSAQIQSVGKPRIKKKTSEDEKAEAASGAALRGEEGTESDQAKNTEDDDDDDDFDVDDSALGLDILEEDVEKIKEVVAATPPPKPVDEYGDNDEIGEELMARAELEPSEEELVQWAPDSFNTGDTIQLNDYYMTFDEFEDSQAKVNEIGSRYLSSVFDTYAKRVGELVFLAARRKMMKDQKDQKTPRPTETYQLVALNFLIDSGMGIHLTGQRTIRPEDAFPNVDALKEDKKDFLDSLAGLVLETNDMPQAFARMRRGDSYKEWRMIFSEIEEKQRPTKYEACEIFRRNLMLTVGSIRKNAWLHNYAEKRHAANKRELNKYIEKKWDQCKHRPTREMMASCIRNTISYRYKLYLAKENAPYQDGYVEMRIRDLYAKWEIARKANSGDK
eukprot:CAMPEP_0203745080 /NCGR_PEP_ID=MMETSP0098-20131031/939_1 /ASSEMBLY_ACC=CAM_ASM_000208 /TAXON_ID=96639 /ORGANISM=" , Strain NY0313808BC1" /LENGTH=1521 /DNA_ID=CAMNT_0050632771 /DNA_START=76 /DNA_END=4641 /DNA_ORIENTATION=+